MKEDPTRDPASEARDDHASEPRATPETDAASFSTVYQGELVRASFARRLERQRDEWHGAFLLAAKRAGDAGELLVGLKRQRDELLEALYAIEERFVDGCDTYDDWKFMGETARAAIAAVKGGTP
jgi:hypothetical protein